MNINISDSWKSIFSRSLKKTTFHRLISFVRSEYKRYTCYPKGNEIFSAFDRCSFENAKVVILGQDPYHGEGQANGLCFSVHEWCQTSTVSYQYL